MYATQQEIEARLKALQSETRKLRRRLKELKAPARPARHACRASHERILSNLLASGHPL